jgi:hypothetical protein
MPIIDKINNIYKLFSKKRVQCTNYNGRNFTFEKDNIAIIIEHYEDEDEYWMFVSKNGKFILRKEIHSSEDLNQIEQLAYVKRW